MPCNQLIIEGHIETRLLYDLSHIQQFGVYSDFDIKFQSMRITEITEVPVYTSDDFFSDVGSWLGLLVGMSFLSIVEIVAFIFAVIKERLA